MSLSIDHSPGVSWGAILAGAASAAALSFILLILGFGLGLSAVSPWSNSGASLAAIGISSIVWVAITQIASSGLGGYIAGRLRVRWASVHSDEIYFRDTAHGLITWAVATLAAAVLLTTTLTTVLGGGLQATATVGGRVMDGAANAVSNLASESDSYFTDALLRDSSRAGDGASADSARAEIATIFIRSLSRGEFNADDTQYVGSVISRFTGLSQREAETRVEQVFEQAQLAALEIENAAREAADTARQSASYSALWMFIALLSGAFFASLMATFGGKQRDSVTYVERDTLTTRDNKLNQ